MKYLIKRNDFLRGAKRLDEKSEFLRDAKISGNELYQELIKESEYATNHGSGPLANDIGWHDSLIGRFLNHLVRKAKVAANLIRIKNVISSLEGEFVRIQAEGVAYKMNEEEKKLWFKVQLNNIFYSLKDAVERGDEVSVIINMTESSITSVNSFEDDQIDKELKTKLLKELQDFLEFLKTLEEEEKEDAQDADAQDADTQDADTQDADTQDADAQDEQEVDDEVYSKLESSVPTMIKNLSALYNILKNYKSVNILDFNKKEEDAAKKSVPYITKVGDTIVSIQQSELNIKKLTADQIIGKNELELKPTLDAALKRNIPKEKATLPAGLELILEKQGNSVDGNNVYKEEDYLTQAFTKLKADINALTDTKDGKLAINTEFLRILLAKHKDGKNDRLIMALYDNINKYLVGSKKQTIQEKDPLYKESYEYLMPKNEENPNGGKIEVVAEKIARFSKRALQFDGKNLYGGLGELGDPLKKFVETMKILMKNPIVNVNPEYSKQLAEKEKNKKFVVGREYLYTNKEGVTSVVKLVSLTHDMQTGADKKWLTPDDVKKDTLKNGLYSVILKDKKGKYSSGSTNFAISPEKLKPYEDQKAKETKYKKDELIKDIESATKKALELRKTAPESAEKIQINIDKMKVDLDKLDESVNESTYISKYMKIQSGIGSILLELNDALKETNNKPGGRLLKFDRFMSYIKEADEASDPISGMSRSERVQDWFDKKCMTVKDYTMEKTEMDKVKSNFDKLKEQKDSFVIDGYDPIIEILKLFNRAYKLYMAKYITKRSTGPGASTEAEYTSFGEKGPYRNDKIFDSWESAVLDIMKDREYQTIFDKKTMLRVGDEMRPNAGANLRKFMTDMLDGENLYKTKGGYGEAGKGKQAELLDKYFGPADEKTEAEIEKNGTGLGKDLEENPAIAEEVSKNAIKAKVTKCEDAFFSDSKALFPIANAFLIIKGKNDKGPIQRSIFIQKIEGRFVYLQYSKSFGTFKGYLDKIQYGAKVELADEGDIKQNNERSPIYYTKVKVDDFANLLLKAGQLSVGRLDNDGKEDEEKISIEGSYWITKEAGGKQVVFDAVQKGEAQGTDELKKKQLLNAIERANNKTGIVTLIDARDKIIIKRT
jgi:hypothetical protein